MVRHAGRWLVAAAAILACFGCGAEDSAGDEDVGDWEGAAAVKDAPKPQAGSVSFGRDTNERAKGVHIRDKKHEHGEVIYSVRLPDLSSKEQLRLRGEVTLSRCNEKDIAGLSGDAKTTPCNSKHMKKNPYGYTPRFSATFVLSDSPKKASTKNAVSGWFDMDCTEGKHHCALVIPEMTIDKVPDASEKYLNLVVTADAKGKNARSWDVMEVELAHGGLYVTRIDPGAGGPAITKETHTAIPNGSMGIDQTEDEGDKTQVKHLIYQTKLVGLMPGDVVDADAKMQAILGGGFSCDPLITTRLILTEDPNAREPKDDGDAALTVKNGHNCTDHSNNGCKYEKSGAAQLNNKAAGTMYLSLVAVALRSCAAPNGGDTWHVGSGGFIEATVRR